MSQTLSRSAKPSWKPSDEQEAVRQAVAQRHGSVMVEAGAGCAKSSTLELSAPGVKVPALATAFNKSIATGLAKRLPGNFTCKTMNGLGHGAWIRGAGLDGGTVKLEPRKLGTLVSQMAKADGLELTTAQWQGVREMVEKVMQWGLVPQAADLMGESLVPDCEATWADAAAEAGLGEAPEGVLVRLAQRVLDENITLARQGIISFDDLVYCSAMLGGRFVRFPVLMVDENQDLSRLNHRILSMSLQPGGRLITVGDKRQAIYAFRGAAGESASEIRKLLPEGQWKNLALMTTYRCPRAVVARQQSHVPGYQAAPAAPEGLVETFPDTDGGPEDTTWGVKQLQEAQANVAICQRQPTNPSLAVLCRNNAPLLRLAFALIRQRVAPVMLGRDIGKGLMVLVKKISPKAATLEAFAGALREWEEKECALAKANGKPERQAGIRDRAECLRAVMDGASLRDSGDLATAVETLFAREHGAVTLSSIHLAKGLEWDVVLHLDPWRIGLGIRRASEAGDAVGVQQELNLRYVCETRTRHTLLLGSMDSFR